jgi:hypothetical protein
MDAAAMLQHNASPSTIAFCGAAKFGNVCGPSIKTR